MSTIEDQIRKMYEGQLISQKEQLTQDYTKADADLTAQKEKLQKTTDENLNRTAVNAQIAAMNNERYNAASGLSSGAAAQARLSLENQAQANMTALRAAQTEADADVERRRSILSQEYASAIRKAQADNDLALAQALYEEAERKEAELRAQQEAAANLMAQAGDYTRVGTLYGLSDAEVKKLSGASSGSTVNAGVKTQNWDNGTLDRAQVEELQKALNAKGAKLTEDGLYGKKTEAAVKEHLGNYSLEYAYEQLVTKPQAYAALRATVNEAQRSGEDKNTIYALIQKYQKNGDITPAQAGALWMHMNY